jgi:pimeloyl-ACP methyl ester carboxylesterase
MELAAIDGIEVEYELRGSGEPVVVIHWGVSARWAEPLLAEPILAERYRVLRIWARGVFGAGYRASLDRGLPGVFEEILACADTFFAQELPAVQQWSFAETDARRIAQPVLAVLGENCAPTFRERRDLLLAWLPRVEPFDLPGATHLLHIERPHEMAEALSSFFARHPLEPSS